MASLCSFCPTPVPPQDIRLPWLKYHLQHFHNITQQTEDALCLNFLNLNEKMKLQQLVAPRIKFLEWGEHFTDGNIFGPTVNMVPGLDETLVMMSDQELKDIQDHLLAEGSDDNCVNKKVSEEELKDIQDRLLSDFSEDSGQEEDEETFSEALVGVIPKDKLILEIKDTQTKLREALGLTPPYLNGHVNVNEMVKVELEEKENNDSFCHLCYTNLNPPNSFEEHNIKEHKDDQEALNMEYSVEDLVHSCNRCPLKFLTTNLLLKHKQTWHKIREKKGKVKCTICERPVKRLNISRHIKTHGKAQFECKLCYTKFKLHEYLVNHQKSIHKNEQYLLEQELKDEDLRYKCRSETCSKRFLTQDSLHYHMKYGHKDETNTYDCKYCTEQFSSPRTLQKHLRRMHNEKKSYKLSEQHECKLCYKLCDTKENFRSHKRCHSEDKEAFFKTIIDEDLIYTCQSTGCGKKFISEHILKYHLRNNHKEIEFKHLQKGSATSKASCPLCHLQFKSFYTMHSHLIDIHQEDKDLLKEGATQISPEIQCTDCKLRFVRPSILMYHKSRIHRADSKRFQCEKCPKKFRAYRKFRLHNLKVHKKKIEKIESELTPYKISEQYKCKLCYKLFSKKRYMKSHERVHSEDKEAFFRTIADDDLVYSCENSRCGQKFISEFILKHHIRNNHKEMEFKHLQMGSATSKTSCPLCHLQFKSFYTMHGHLLDKHHEDKDLLMEGATQLYPEIQCTDCKLRFVRPSILVFHKSRVHRADSKRFQCDNCPLWFNLYKKFRFHNLKVHKKKIEKFDGDISYECKLCYHMFGSRSNMLTHQRKFHTDDIHYLNRDILKEELIFSCLSCNKGFLSEHLLKYHTKRQHSKAFHCKLCYYDFKCERNLKEHTKKLHKTNEELEALASDQIDEERLVNPCFECNHKFLTKNILNFHIRYGHMNNTSGKGDNTYCKFCYVNFKRASKLQKHQEILHKDEMASIDMKLDEAQLKQVCKHCDKKFLSEKILAYHTRYIHKDKFGVDKYCKLCYIEFKQPSWFRKHQKSLHKEEMFAFVSKQEITDLKFPCTCCDKKFMTENILQYHTRYSHQRQSPGEAKTCNHCNKHFSWDKKITSRFNKHMKGVHGIDERLMQQNTEPDETLVNFQHMMKMLNNRENKSLTSL